MNVQHKQKKVHLVSDFATVLYSVKNRVATISLNRPESLNSFNVQMRQDLLAAIRQADADTNVRVVVIDGCGRGFSAGADLTESYIDFHDNIEGQLIKEYKPFLMAIHDSSKIFISSIKGVAAGIGSTLAMACDLSIMEENAYIFQAFSAIGLIPDGGASWHLLRTLGKKRAFAMIIDADKVSAKACLELGLTNRVVSTDELSEATQAWAEKLAAGAPLVQKYAKEVLQKGLHMALTDVIDLEATYQNIVVVSEDAAEGSAAFFEKRQPVFKGK